MVAVPRRAIYSHEKYLSTDLASEKEDRKAAQRINVNCRKERGKKQRSLARPLRIKERAQAMRGDQEK